MRLPIAAATALFVLTGIHSLSAQQPAEGPGFGPRFLPKKQQAPMADATTDEQLRARQSGERFGGVAPPEKQVRTHDLVSTSTFLQAGEFFTIIPKGAVIHAPEKLAAFVVGAPAGKFQAWPEFLAANRKQISTFEITIDQATGKVPLDQEKFTLARKSGCLIVATCRGGPVSASIAVPAPQTAQSSN